MKHKIIAEAKIKKTGNSSLRFSFRLFFLLIVFFLLVYSGFVVFPGSASAAATSVKSRVIVPAAAPNPPQSFDVTPDDSSASAAEAITYGQDVTFTATATDPNGDNWFLLVCDSSGMTQSGSVCVCDGSQLCLSAATTSAQEANCQHTVSESGTSQAWYAYAYDTPLDDCDMPGDNTNTPYYINQLPVVDTPVTHDSSLSVKTEFNVTDLVRIRVNVTDANGEGDLDTLLVNISRPDDSLNVSGAAMTNVASITNGYTYEYNFTIDAQSGVAGSWTVTVYGNDSFNAWDTDQVSFTVANPISVSGVSASPQLPRDGVAVNVSATVSIQAGPSSVDTVQALVYYPNGTLKETVALTGGPLYSGSMTSDFTPAGTYNVTIWANDSAGTVNQDEKTWFAPYLNLSDEETLTIDGTFSDWDFQIVSEPSGDSGGGAGMFNQIAMGTASGTEELELWDAQSGSMTLVFNPTLPEALPPADVIKFGDIDNDGKIEMVVGLGYNTGETMMVMIFENDSGGAIENTYNITSFCGTPTGIAIGDVDRDGKNELLLWHGHWSTDHCDPTGGGLLLFENDTVPGGPPYDEMTLIDGTVLSAVAGLVVGDVLGSDGTPPQIIYVNGSGSPNLIDVYENISGGMNFMETFVSGTGAVDDMGLADIDGDDVMEIIECGGGANATVWKYNTTSNEFEIMWQYHDPDAVEIAVCKFGRFNHDDYWDIMVSIGHPTKHIMFFEGSATDYEFTNTWNSSFMWVISYGGGAGDVNGDGYDDFAFVNGTGDLVYITNTTGGPPFEMVWVADTGGGAGNVVGVGDLNNHGTGGGDDFDLVNVSLANDETYLYGLLEVNGSVDYSSGKYYRLFIDVDSATGSTTTPDSGESLPFKYDFMVESVSETSWKVYNSSDDEIASLGASDVKNSSDMIELRILLSTLGASTGDSYNVTFESGTADERYDIAPDILSFLVYDLVGAMDFAPPGVTDVDVTPQLALNGTAINVSATVIDAAGNLDTVFAMLYYPNGTNYENITMDNGGSGDVYWNDSYTVNFYPHGTHNVTIWANDSGNYINQDEKTWFAPYLNLSDAEDITIDGTFSDWNGVKNVSDPIGDAGSGGGGGPENVTSDLSETDPGDWLTNAPVMALTFDSTNNLVYLGALQDKFGVYNITSNVTSDLSATDPGDWIGSDNVLALTHDSTNDLVYLGAAGGKFGVYNITTNVTSDLSETDPGGWLSTSIVYALTFDSTNNLVYLGAAGGKFGVYDITSNVTSNLNETDPGDWIGSDTVDSLTFDPTNDLVYLGAVDGKFGVYTYETGGGGTDFDLKTLSLANDDTYLYGLLEVNGSVDYSSGKYYRLFIDVDSATGNNTTPDSNESLPFKYDFMVESFNETLWQLYNSSDYNTANLTSSDVKNSSDMIELRIPLTNLSLSEEDKINATFESGTADERYDIAPDYPSFLEYTIATGVVVNLTSIAVWDETDAQGGGATKYPNDDVTFYANYTNSSGYPVNTTLASDPNCTLNIYNVSQWTGMLEMSYDSPSGLYEYNMTTGFTSLGTYDWNVRCNATAHRTKTDSDTVSITSPTWIYSIEYPLILVRDIDPPSTECGADSVEGGYCGCSASYDGYRCDVEVDETWDGVCANTGSGWDCDINAVFYDGSDYRTTGSSATDGYKCDADVAASGFEQDGMGSASSCDSTGHVVCNGGAGSACVAACSASEGGYECDDTITSGDFIQNGVCATNDSGTTYYCDSVDEVAWDVGSSWVTDCYINDTYDYRSNTTSEWTCDADLTDGNAYAYYLCIDDNGEGAGKAASCDSDGDVCDDGGSSNLLAPDCSYCVDGQECMSTAGDSWTSDGLCASDDNCCTTDYESGGTCGCTVETDETSNPNQCDTNADGTWDGVCSDSNGDTSGGTASCDTTEVCDDGTYYADDCYDCSEMDVCDADVDSGGFVADGVCIQDDNNCCNTFANGTGSSELNACGSESAVCGAGTNGMFCDDVSDAAWDTGTAEGTDKYRCDESETSCRLCEANDTEATGSSPLEGTAYECESGCGAPSACDDVLSGGLTGSTCCYVTGGACEAQTCECTVATLDDGGDSCCYVAAGDYCSSATGCTNVTETCPDFCIDDNNGGTCAQTTRADPTSAERCYWTDTCGDSGCSLTSGVADNLRANYCDFCTASGNQSGEFSPPLNATCASSCVHDSSNRYWSGTASRADDCWGANATTNISIETYKLGYIYPSQTAAGNCDDTECTSDCGEASTCDEETSAGTCTCGTIPPTVGSLRITDGVTPTYPNDNIIWCNSTITDADGYDTVSTVWGKLWDDAAKNEGDIDDTDDHYTNASCGAGDNDGDTKVNYSCAFTVSWYANPAEWTCIINATDESAESDENSRADLTINAFVGYNTTDSVPFGEMDIGETTSEGSEPELNVTNQGTTIFDVNLTASAAMVCSDVGSIAYNKIHYNTSSMAYGAMCVLGTTCQATEYDFDLAPRDSASSVDPWKAVFFAINIPTGAGGACSTTVSIVFEI